MCGFLDEGWTSQVDIRAFADCRPTLFDDVNSEGIVLPQVPNIVFDIIDTLGNDHEREHSLDSIVDCGWSGFSGGFRVCSLD
jgi:hypothetical protein